LNVGRKVVSVSSVAVVVLVATKIADRRHQMQTDFFCVACRLPHTDPRATNHRPRHPPDPLPVPRRADRTVARRGRFGDDRRRAGRAWAAGEDHVGGAALAKRLFRRGLRSCRQDFRPASSKSSSRNGTAPCRHREKRQPGAAVRRLDRAGGRDRVGHPLLPAIMIKLRCQFSRSGKTAIWQTHVAVLPVCRFLRFPAFRGLFPRGS
jgi:hypothetical protein